MALPRRGAVFIALLLLPYVTCNAREQGDSVLLLKVMLLEQELNAVKSNILRNEENRKADLQIMHSDIKSKLKAIVAEVVSDVIDDKIKAGDIHGDVDGSVNTLFQHHQQQLQQLKMFINSVSVRRQPVPTLRRKCEDEVKDLKGEILLKNLKITEFESAISEHIRISEEQTKRRNNRKTADETATETVYATCLDKKRKDGTTYDGDYWLTPAAPQMMGWSIKVYCHDMASPAPREFITLPNHNEGEYPNKNDLRCRGEVPYLHNGVKKHGHYFFYKIAVQIETMTVKKDDYTFIAIPKGKSYPYGHAQDCYAGNDVTCGFKGNFHINTLQTGLMIDPQLTWIGNGRMPKTPLVQRSEGGAKIDIFCGGACGGCEPEGEITLYPNTGDLVTPRISRLHKSLASAPATCLDKKEKDGTTDDGEYWLTPAAPQMLGKPIKVYCYDMASQSPREFITLPNPNEGEYPNKSDLWCRGEVPYLEYSGVGKQGHYFFNKIAVQIETMIVKKYVYEFVNIPEGKIYPYGHAQDCYAGNDLSCGTKGNFHINTLKTGLMIDPQLTWIGNGRWPKTPKIQRSEGGAKIDIFCGGVCGGCEPDGEITLYPNTGDVVTPSP